MNYTAIMNALPKTVATILQQNLDDMDANSMSPDVIHSLVVEAVERTKAEMNIDPMVEGMVKMLLDQVPNAAVQVLCLQ